MFYSIRFLLFNAYELLEWCKMRRVFICCNSDSQTDLKRPLNFRGLYIHKNLVYPDQVGPEMIRIDKNPDNPEKSKNVYRLYNRQSYKSVVPDIQGDSWRTSFLQGIDLSCHADEKSSYEYGSDFSYYRRYEVYNIWNWIMINWSNQSNYWLKWYWMVHWKN